MTAVHRTGKEPQPVPIQKLALAKRLMRQGWDLDEAAIAIGARVRDLDLSLWIHIGNLEEGWD